MRIESYSIDLASRYDYFMVSTTTQNGDGDNAKIKTATTEKESLALSAHTDIKTQNNQLSISMTAALLYQNTSIKEMTVREQRMADPLVINLEGALAGIDKNAKFSFDIDSDGKKEGISLLSYGSGFLAIDKNGDRVINDGSELFGAKSGDGFADLAAYDDTGDGVIDGNDKIFDKLRIWLKTASEDKLLSLSDARVGALLLANTSSQFGLRGESGVDAQIRKSGIAIGEDGQGLWVSHIDFAISNIDENKPIQSQAQRPKIDTEKTKLNKISQSDNSNQIEATINELEQKLKETNAKLLKSIDETEIKILKAEKTRLTEQIVTLQNISLTSG